MPKEYRPLEKFDPRAKDVEEVILLHKLLSAAIRRLELQGLEISICQLRKKGISYLSYEVWAVRDLNRMTS